MNFNSKYWDEDQRHNNITIISFKVCFQAKGALDGLTQRILSISICLRVCSRAAWVELPHIVSLAHLN